MNMSPEAFLSVMSEKGYRVYSDAKQPFNLNIVGWRYAHSLPDRFDDLLAVYIPLRNGEWVYRAWPVTTRPGIPWLINPMNKKGAAIMVPGQYKQAYSIGWYKGYKALRQVRPVEVYRDADYDYEFDMSPDTIERGLFGIHIHRAGLLSKVVGQSSAGCQVFQTHADFKEFMTYCEAAELHWGNKFTYTLLETE